MSEKTAKFVNNLGYHAHIYYDPTSTRAVAEGVCAALGAQCQVEIEAFRDTPRGPHPGEPTPQEVRERGTAFCVGTPAECIRFLERYEALGIEEVFMLCAIGPAQHQEVLHTIRLFGEQVIPHFQAKTPRTVVAQTSA